MLARLNEAVGHVLAEPITRLVADPPTDLAAQNGYAVRGKGPWVLQAEPTRQPGHCHQVRLGDGLPAGTVAVLTLEQTESERTRDGGVRVLARDALTGLPDPAAKATSDEGIIRKGSWAQAGELLVAAQRPLGPVLVTPAMIALAAAAGHDAITVVRPPTVSTIVMGDALQAAGLPKHGRARDALGDALPAYATSLGARANPTVRSIEVGRQLPALIEDANADLIITTGAMAATRQAVTDLGARWLVDGIAMSPGGPLLLARLPDDRVLLALPGDPTAALAGAVTVLGPMISSMRAVEQPSPTTAILSSAAPPPDRATDTSLVPVSLMQHDGQVFATPLPAAGPAGLAGWASADAVAIIAPGLGYRDDEVEVLELAES